jgi:hypothetical protein
VQSENLVAKFGAIFSALGDLATRLSKIITDAQLSSALGQLGPIGSVVGSAVSVFSSLFGQPSVMRRPVATSTTHNINVSLPSMNLMQMARGAEFQFVLREGIRSAQHGGFRSNG